MDKNDPQKRPEAKFLVSAAYYKELPEPEGDEFAVIGRSNVGKSSFINHVLENRALARISKKPGKTSLANFYRVSETMVWVDLPGYGYAKTSGSERTRWSQLIASYCEKRSNLRGIIWLIDIRHIGVKNDVEAWQWLKRLNIPVFPVLTKADKLTTREKALHIKQACSFFGFSTEPVVYSINQHDSRRRFWEKFDIWRRDSDEVK